MKKAEVMFVGKIYAFAECSKENMLNSFDGVNELRRYLPDSTPATMMNKRYLFDVYSLGYEWHKARVGRS